MSKLLNVIDYVLIVAIEMLGAVITRARAAPREEGGDRDRSAGPDAALHSPAT